MIKPAINLKIGDIGRSTKSGYTCIEDFHGPHDYVAVIHGGTDGFLPIGHKVPKEQKLSGWDERCFHRDQLTPERLNKLSGRVDYYLGMATMLRPKRLVSNLKKLNALFADIDCRDVGLTPMQALRLFLDKYCGKKVPVPTFIICSGRGLQIIWVIREDRKAHDRWSRVEKHLVNVLKPLGADSKATDAARVLRMPFTKNSKGGDAEIWAFCDVCYTIYEIAKKFNILGGIPKKKRRKVGKGSLPPTEKQIESIANIAHALNENPPKFETRADASRYIKDGCRKINARVVKSQSRKASTRKRARYNSNDKNRQPGQINEILRLRMADVETLAPLKKGKDCGRQNIVAYYRLWVGEVTGDYDFALEEALRINSLFKCPLSDNEVRSATASMERKLRSGSTYFISDRALMDEFKITEEEEKHLRYLTWERIERCEKESRRERRRANRREKLRRENKLTRDEKIDNQLESLAELSAKGFSRDEICAKLEISIATFYRYKGRLERKQVEMAFQIESDVCETGRTAMEGTPAVEEIPITKNTPIEEEISAVEIASSEEDSDPEGTAVNTLGASVWIDPMFVIASALLREVLGATQKPRWKAVFSSFSLFCYPIRERRPEGSPASFVTVSEIVKGVYEYLTPLRHRVVICHKVNFFRAVGFFRHGKCRDGFDCPFPDGFPALQSCESSHLHDPTKASKEPRSGPGRPYAPLGSLVNCNLPPGQSQIPLDTLGQEEVKPPDSVSAGISQPPGMLALVEWATSLSVLTTAEDKG